MYFYKGEIIKNYLLNLRLTITAPIEASAIAEIAIGRTGVVPVCGEVLLVFVTTVVLFADLLEADEGVVAELSEGEVGFVVPPVVKFGVAVMSPKVSTTSFSESSEPELIL